MRRRKPDTMEIQQMKSQAMNERERKQVNVISIFTCDISSTTPSLFSKSKIEDS